jgi:hypothetical protein
VAVSKRTVAAARDFLKRSRNSRVWVRAFIGFGVIKRVVRASSEAEENFIGACDAKRVSLGCNLAAARASAQLSFEAQVARTAALHGQSIRAGGGGLGELDPAQARVERLPGQARTTRSRGSRCRCRSYRSRPQWLARYRASGGIRQPLPAGPRTRVSDRRVFDTTRTFRVRSVLPLCRCGAPSLPSPRPGICSRRSAGGSVPAIHTRPNGRPRVRENQTIRSSHSIAGVPDRRRR